MLRTLGVIAFIGIVGATGIYFATRSTVARGHVVAADLQAGNTALKSLQCDDQIPIGMTGATFTCDYELASGEKGRAKIVMNRAGSITSLEDVKEEVKIEKTGDPWAD